MAKAFTEGFYGKPRVDDELLEQYHEGLICLSACLGGYIPSLLSRGDYDEAKRYALFLRETFGADNFYLEMQDHGIEEQRPVNQGVMRIARETGLPLVVTNDAHYLRREDAAMQDVLLCIQTGKTVDDTNRMKFQTEEFYLKSEEEMRSLFPGCDDAIENTVGLLDFVHKTPFVIALKMGNFQMFLFGGLFDESQQVSIGREVINDLRNESADVNGVCRGQAGPRA